MNKEEELAKLCSEYIWLVLIGCDQTRYELHCRIGSLLDLDKEHSHVGYIQWAFNNLEKAAALPSSSPSKKWKELSTRCGKRLSKALLRVYSFEKDGDTIVHPDNDQMQHAM